MASAAGAGAGAGVLPVPTTTKPGSGALGKIAESDLSIPTADMYPAVSGARVVDFEFLRSPLEATEKLMCHTLPTNGVIPGDTAARLGVLFTSIKRHYASEGWPSMRDAELLLTELRRRLPVPTTAVPSTADTNRAAAVFAVRDVSVTSPPAGDIPLYGMKGDPVQQRFTTEMRILSALPELSRLTQDVLHLFHVRSQPLFMGRPSNWLTPSAWRLVGFSPLLNAMLNAVDTSAAFANANAMFSVQGLASALVAGPPRAGAASDGTASVAPRANIETDGSLANALRPVRREHSAAIKATMAHGQAVRMRDRQTALLFSAKAVACHLDILQALAKATTLSSAAQTRIDAFVADIKTTIAPEQKHRVMLVRDADADSMAWRESHAAAAAVPNGDVDDKQPWTRGKGSKGGGDDGLTRGRATVMKAVLWDVGTGKSDDWFIFMSSVQRATRWCEFLWLSGLHPFSAPAHIGRGNPQTDAETQLQYTLTFETPMSYTRLSGAFVDAAGLYFGGPGAIGELADKADRKISEEFEFDPSTDDGDDDKQQGSDVEHAVFSRRHVVQVKLQLWRLLTDPAALGRQQRLSGLAVSNLTLIVNQLKAVLALKRPVRFTVARLNALGYGALCVVLALLDTTHHRTSLMKDVYSAVASGFDLTMNRAKAKTLVHGLYRDVHRTVFANAIVDHCMAYVSKIEAASAVCDAWGARLGMAASTQTRWGGTRPGGVAAMKSDAAMASLFALSDSMILHGPEGERTASYSEVELLALAPHVSLRTREAALLRMLTESAGVRAVLWERIHTLNALRMRRLLSSHASVKHAETQRQLEDELRSGTSAAHLMAAQMIRAECAPSSGPAAGALAEHEWENAFGASPTANPEIKHVDTARVRQNFEAALGSKSGTGAWLTTRGMLLSAFLDAINGLATLREHRESGRVVHTLLITPSRLIECASMFFALTTRSLWGRTRDPVTGEMKLNHDDAVMTSLLKRASDEIAGTRVPPAIAGRVRRILFRGDAAGATRLAAYAASKHRGEKLAVYAQWVASATRVQPRFIGSPRESTQRARRREAVFPLLETAEARVTDAIAVVSYRSVTKPVFLRLPPPSKADAAHRPPTRGAKLSVSFSEPVVLSTAAAAVATDAPSSSSSPDDEQAALSAAAVAATAAETVLGGSGSGDDADADTSDDGEL